MREKQQKALEYINSLDNTKKELYLKILNGPIEEMGVNQIKIKCDLLGFDIEQYIDLEKISEDLDKNNSIENDKEDDFIIKVDKNHTILSNLWAILIKFGQTKPSQYLPTKSEIDKFIDRYNRYFKENILKQCYDEGNIIICDIPSLYEFYKHEILENFNRTTTGRLSETDFLHELLNNEKLYNIVKVDEPRYARTKSAYFRMWKNFEYHIIFTDLTFSNLRNKYKELNGGN